ncbi:MAG: hypothetical protein ABR529_05930 [Actinomycetota bacterium]
MRAAALIAVAVLCVVLGGYPVVLAGPGQVLVGLAVFATTGALASVAWPRAGIADRLIGFASFTFLFEYAIALVIAGRAVDVMSALIGAALLTLGETIDIALAVSGAEADARWLARRVLRLVLMAVAGAMIAAFVVLAGSYAAGAGVVLFSAGVLAGAAVLYIIVRQARRMTMVDSSTSGPR